MQRGRLTRRQALAVREAAGGLCHICQAPIGIGQRWHIDHVKPLWLGGLDELGNMAPAHDRCHISKTSMEAGTRAKSDRARARHLGIKKFQPRPLPGTIASGWKRKMRTGKWERRK